MAILERTTGALPALCHRVVLAFATQAEGLDVDTVLGRIQG